MFVRLYRPVPTSFVLFLFFFTIYSFTMSGWLQYGGEMEKYRVAQSIVDRHSFAIRPIATRSETGVGGQTYSIYEMGQTVLEVPFYAVGRVVYSFFPVPDVNWITLLFVGFLNPLITALTCVVLFKTGLSLGFHHRTSVALAVLFGLGTIAWPYSRGFDREPLLALLILLSFYAAFLFARAYTEKYLIIAGFAAGYLVFTKFIQAMIIPILLIYLSFVIFQRTRTAGLDRRRVVLAIARGCFVFLFPMLFFLGLQGIYALARFGTAYSGMAGSKFNVIDVIIAELGFSQPIAAVAGLLFSSEKSVFLYSPPALLFLFAWSAWFKSNKKEALLLLGLILIEFSSAAGRAEWWGGPRWGPRYLVQIIPLLIIPLGVVDTLSPSIRRFWAGCAALLFAAGLFVQGVGVLTNEREYLDAMGKDPTLAGQFDFLRHGAIDSLVLSLSPGSSIVAISPFGVLLIAMSALLFLLILWRIRHPEGSEGRLIAGSVLALLILLLEFSGLVGWEVAPFSQVLADKGDTRYTAGNSFLADGRKLEARSMYLFAFDYGTRYRHQAAERLAELVARSQGDPATAQDLMNQTVGEEIAIIEPDDGESLFGGESLKISIPGEKNADAFALSDWIAVEPSTTYELSGWVKTESVYGTGYGVISVAEDNGSWKRQRTIDVMSTDETHGWRPFKRDVTTLPTTRRLLIRTGLNQTYGTLWVAGVQLAKVTK